MMYKMMQVKSSTSTNTEIYNHYHPFKWTKLQMEAIKNCPVIESHDAQNNASEVIDEYQHRDPDEGTSTFAVHQSASEIKVHNNSG